jgi:hypothetical protein
MVIEKIADEFIIRIPATGDISDIQDFLNYLRFRELTSKFTASTADVDSIVSSVKQNWRERCTPNV